jgi:outer membrane protein assembly factor BamB
MPLASWFQSRPAILVWSVLLPPVGLILLLTRPSTGIARKLVGSLAIVVLGIFYLVVFFGLRLVPDGSGLPKIVTFESPEADAEALERSRAERPEGGAVPSPAGAATAEAGSIDPAPMGEPKLVSEAAASGGVYWTDFRGPGRDGDYDEMAIRTAWPPEGLTPLWRQPVGGGYASFVIAEGRAFTIEQRRNQEVVAAYDTKTGRELWTQSWGAAFQERMGGDGPRATPTWHEGRVYALGATGELRALDAGTGKILWAKNILSENRARNLTWGMAASPLIVDDKVIMLPGGGGASIVAYDKQTGDVIWKALSDQQAYTSPMLVTLAGRRQILVVSAERMVGITVENGTVLWDIPWVTQYGINAAQPIIVDDNHFFISAGYGHGAALVEVNRTSDGMTARPVWQNVNMKNKFTSSVLHEGYVYGLDEAILACIDVRTGKRMWKGGRYGYGQVILASGHLIVLTERGDLVLVKATPERHEEVARFSAIEGKTWNHPAMADGILLVRNLREMAAFKLN